MNRKNNITFNQGSWIFITMVLLFSVSVFPKKMVLPQLNKPDSIQVKNQRIYITENEKIFIYSLPDLKPVKTFGRAGQGPQELQLYQNSMKYREKICITIFKNQIWVGSLRKMSCFSKNGDFIREKRLTDPLAIAMAPLGNHYIGVSMDREGFAQWTYSFNIYNSFGRKVKTLCSHKKSMHAGQVNKVGIGYVFIDRLTKGPEYVLYGNNIYISGGPGFTIDVYNQNGERIKKISHPYRKQKIASSEKPKILKAHRGSRMEEHVWKQAKKIIKVPDYYPEFRTFQISDQKIYVQTFKKSAGRTEFLIFNLEGNLSGQVYVPLKYNNFIEPFRYVIYSGTMYQLHENLEKEEWELYITNLNN